MLNYDNNNKRLKGGDKGDRFSLRSILMYIDIYSLEEKDIFNCTVIEEKLISISNYPLHSRDLVANVVRFKED